MAEPVKGIFVPAEWVGKNVIVQLDMPSYEPTSDIASAVGHVGVGGQTTPAALMAAMQQARAGASLAFPQIPGKLLADLPEGLVLAVSMGGKPFHFSIMKGKIHGVLLEVASI